MVYRKWLKTMSTISAVLAIIGSTTVSVHAATYLTTGQNYYNSNISKGFLDEVISATTVQGATPESKQATYDALVQAAADGKITYTPGMTFNEFYLANKLSPEDNFMTYRNPSGVVQRIGLLDNATQWINARADGASLVAGHGLTYVGPTDHGGAYWGSKATTPVTFSRLTVGELPKVTPTNHNYPSGIGLKHFSRDSWSFPTLLGYGEDNTMMDYMLTSENDVLIPARFNTLREDVYLTMRSRGAHGANIDGARAYLTATLNGQPVKSKAENANAYLNVTTSLFLTPASYNQLGSWGRLAIAFGSVQTASKTLLTDIGVYEFSSKTGNAISQFETSNGRSLVSGLGGQMQVAGFYRESDIDNDTVTDETENYAATSIQRKQDATNTIRVNYFMYSNHAQFSERPEIDITKFTGVPSGAKLISPNVSEYGIEITRPYFQQFETTNAVDVMDLTNDNFDTLLGNQSFEVVDNGKKANGQIVDVDLERVRVRLSTDGTTFISEAITLDRLKEELLNNAVNYENSTLTVAYTYAATDSKDSIVGKLPNEITNNEGAYAIPFVRTVTIPAKITTRHIDTNGVDIIAEEIGFKAALKKAIPLYTFKETQTSGNVVTHVYYKNLTTRYVDENGVEIDGEVVGESFASSKSIAGYTFKETTVVGDVTTHVYTKDVVVPTQLVTRYVDESDSEIEVTVTDVIFAPVKQIDGYIFKETQVAGNVTRHVYKRMPTTPMKLTTHYVDEAGVHIAPSVTGDSFAPYKDIPGYESLGSKIAGYTRTYLYKKVLSPKPLTTHYIDEEGNTIAPSVTGDSFAPYKDIPGYESLGSKIAGYTRTYLYKKVLSPKPLTTHYIDKDGVNIAPSVTGDKFAPYKEIDGYVSLGSKIAGNVKTYVYEKTTDKQTNTVNQETKLPETGSVHDVYALGLVLIILAYGVYQKRQR